MAKEIFSKKSIDKVSSPEELNDYMKASNPSVWLILSGVMLLLLGVCVWGVTGRLDTVLKTGAVSMDGKTVCYIKTSDIDSIKEGMTVTIQKENYKIASVSKSPQQLDENTEEYLLQIGNFMAGEWVYVVTLDASAALGVYPADIVTKSVSPMSFILN